MGGIRNREEKMKANKVFSSGGGGGGTKGPATIDRRTQEVKCPYCDKIYQQAASGRLKEHIASKHADQLQPAGDGTAASTSGAAAPTAASANAAAAAAPGRNVRVEGKVAAAAAGKDPAVAAAAAAAARSAAQAAGAAAASAGGSSAPSTSTGGGGGMMTLQSRAGYYTSKSPTMHLHEWVQREKRQRARLVPKKLDNGLWTCKVVLPDAKRQEDDIVVFLDEQHAAADEAEARERGAVAALNRVQGDRALERILPRDYLPLWTALGEVRKAREEAQAARRVAEERRKKADEERRKRSNLRTPQVVVMSAAKQRLVQSLLRDRDLDLGGGTTRGSAPDAWDDGESDSDALIDIVEQLSGMGFSPQHVQLAYERRGGGGGGGGALSVESLLDWLLLNLPADQLPGQFTKGSVTNMVNIVARADPGRASLASVARLMAFGYSSSECEAALEAAGGQELAAHVALYGRITGVQLQSPAATASTGTAAAVVGGDAADGDVWAEELMVLESIYDTAFTVQSKDAVRLTLELPEGCSVATRSDAPLLLDFVRLRAADGGAVYPDAAPLVCVTCAGLAAGALRHLTRVLAAESQTLLGQAALHDLATRALEEAAAMDEQACAAAEAGARRAAAKAAAADGEADDGLEREDSSLVEGFEGLMVEEEVDEEGEDGDEPRRRSAAAAGARRARPEEQRRRRPQIDVAAESARLRRLQSDLESGPHHAGMRSSRRSLPAFTQREEVLALLRANDVVVVSGATGCGKSTQVPQYILEEAIAGGEGARCNIIVTQPRRISALGLASRVANERGEKPGETVGYSVRLEHRSSAATRLTFVTTGILLRRLLSDPELEDTTHVVLDEVHERSIEIDLLLLLLRDVLARRRRAAVEGRGGARAPQRQQAPLKLVLMSATADAQQFAEYMTRGSAAAVEQPEAAADGAAGMAAGRGTGGRGGRGGAGAGADTGAAVDMITIPGFTYPVREFYLEDSFELTGHVVGRDNRYARRGGGRDNEKDGGLDRQLSGALPHYSETTLRSLSTVDEDQINYELLVDVIAEIISRHRRDGAAAFMTDWPQAYTSGRGDTSGGGAILVFLPGAPEIGRLQRMLTGSDRVVGAAGGRGNLRVLPLHGSLSSADQTKVFARPPPGCFKVVLSTNVAETSITIDDVTVVVDTGRVKEMSHDAERGILRLQEGWVSKAAAQQRRGRAGRVRPGICFRMFSSEQWGRMPNYTEPEMLRSPLESVCLLIKGMTSGAAGAAAAAAAASAAGGPDGGVAAFLARCLSPPSSKAVSSAVWLLRTIGAFDGSEALTSLGRHLNKMPMDPRVGKALVYGCMLSCLDPVLTVTAAMAHGRPVFLNLQNAADGVAGARRQLLKGAVDSRSDHIALVAAYNAWCRAVDKGGRSAGSSLCAECGLSESSLESIQAGRAEYARVLSELGFLDPHIGGDSRRGSLGPSASLPGSEWLAVPANRNAGNARFLKAALCAGFYPSVLRVDHPKTKYKEVYGGTEEADSDPKDVKFFDRERGRTFIHPGSVLFNVGKFQSGWLVFTQMTETSKLFVREASMVPVYAMLLFGGEVAVDHGAGMLRVDGWAEFKAAANVGVMVRELRTEMDRLLGAKIHDPELQLGSNRIVAAVEQLLSTDGF